MTLLTTRGLRCCATRAGSWRHHTRHVRRWFLPLLGVSLVAFVIIDLILGWRAAHRRV